MISASYNTNNLPPGDWHCAYVLLYGPRPLDVLDDVEIKPYEEPAMDTS